MFRTVLFSLILLLSACTNRDAVFLIDTPPQGAVVHRAFVATQRTAAPDGWFSGDRDPVMRYLALDVSVPPVREPGQILEQTAFRKQTPEKFFGVAKRLDYTGQPEFTRALRQELRQQPPQSRDVILYVHGYNNSFSDGVYRTVQMKHDFDIEGVAVHYSWASAANPLGYTYDRDSVLFSRDGLEQLLYDVSAANPDRIVLVGHSLGTMLVMETLRQIDIAKPRWAERNLGGVMLLSSDLDVEVFEAQANRMASLPQPFVVFVNSRDRALNLSKLINGSISRLGNLSDPKLLDPLPLTVVDISQFSEGEAGGHFTVGTSPLLISLLRRSPELIDAFDQDMAGRSGIASGAVISAKRLTHLVLSPLLLTN